MNTDYQKLKGLRVSIYRSEYECELNLCDRAEMTEIILVGEGIPELSTPDSPSQVFRIVRRKLFGDEIYIHVEPALSGTGFMAGGHFCYSTDSRFRELVNQYPVSIHDRQEF